MHQIDLDPLITNSLTGKPVEFNNQDIQKIKQNEEGNPLDQPIINTLTNTKPVEYVKLNNKNRPNIIKHSDKYKKLDSF